MDKHPHDSWAEVYDLAYEASFGSMYQRLTEQTLSFVNENSQESCHILDIGAGTGRTSIPLAEMGFQVSAIDASEEMLRVLAKKDIERKISTTHSTLQKLDLDQTFDVVLCVFSVFCYITEYEELMKALKNLTRHVKPNGYAFIDVPSIYAFRGLEYKDQVLSRSVSVLEVPGQDALFTYDEHITIETDSGKKTYRDKFHIKHWDPELILDALNSFGMTLNYDASMEFSGSGAHYFKLTWK